MQKAHRAHRPTLTSDEGDKDFWERDMSKLLEEDPGLREDVCKLFRKVEGGSGVHVIMQGQIMYQRVACLLYVKQFTMSCR